MQIRSIAVSRKKFSLLSASETVVCTGIAGWLATTTYSDVVVKVLFLAGLLSLVNTIKSREISASLFSKVEIRFLNVVRPLIVDANALAVYHKEGRVLHRKMAFAILINRVVKVALYAAVFYALYPFLICLTNVIGVLFAAVSHPSITAKHIPRNFFFNCFSRSLFTLEPTVYRTGDMRSGAYAKVKIEDFLFVSECFRRHDLFGEKIARKDRSNILLARLATFFLVCIHWGASFFRHFAIKSTALFFTPIIFLVSVRISPGVNTKDKLDDYNRSKLSVPTLVWSVVVVFIFFAGVLWGMAGNRGFFSSCHFDVLDAGGFVVRYFHSFYLPVQDGRLNISGWSLANAVNAMLFITSYFYADKATRRLASRSWVYQDVKRTLHRVDLVRVVLVSYTYTCTMIWVFKYANVPMIPSVRVDFFP